MQIAIQQRFGSCFETPLCELLSGRAYRAKPADVTVPLSKRLAGESAIVLVVAKEQAAALPIQFSETGALKVGRSRQVTARQPGDVARVLRQEAATVRASTVILVVSLGWQAWVTNRASRSSEHNKAFERFRLLQEEPEQVLSQAKADLIYTAVDHPVLDRAVVFGCKRRDLEELLQEVRLAGLTVASVRLGVAAQLELWLHSKEAAVLDRDLLVSDGMSVLYLNTESGDFSSPTPGLPEAEIVPRQSSARPNEVAQDMVRFMKDSSARPIMLLGSPEFATALGEALGASGISMAVCSDSRVHDSVQAALADETAHDLNPDMHEERPALSPAWRHRLWSVVILAACLLVSVLTFIWDSLSSSAKTAELEAQIRSLEQRVVTAKRQSDQWAKEYRQGALVRSWVLSNYHAQTLLYQLLRHVPEGVALEGLSGRLDETAVQMSLEFTLLGGEESQVAATRALERAILHLNYQIGERSAPLVLHKGRSYRWRLILPVTGGQATP